MRTHQLSRWQKAGALAPMVLLIGAWGAAVGTGSFATEADRVAQSAVPSVPGTAFDEPATIGVAAAPAAAPTNVNVSTLSINGIPTVALTAYHTSATLLAKADPGCKLPWSLVAAIGRVESNHGRTGGNELDVNGVAKPGIYGAALNGKGGRARITDSDDGALDKDKVFDRAVGPMQFIPGTWRSVAVDGDADKKKNPQDIHDAAAAAGVYLCAGDEDLSKAAGAAKAVKRYNHSDSYVRLVLDVAKAYEAGQFNQVPTSGGSTTVLDVGDDSTVSKPKPKPSTSTAPKPSPTSGGGGGTTGGGGGTSSPTPSPTTSPTMTLAQAQAYCKDKHPVAALVNGYTYRQCVAEMTS